MAEVTTTNVRELSTYSADGQRFGQSTADKVGFLGATPITQKAVNTIVTSVDPSTSGCAFLASVHSIAVYAASQVNKLVTALQSYGLIA